MSVSHIFTHGDHASTQIIYYIIIWKLRGNPKNFGFYSIYVSLLQITSTIDKWLFNFLSIKHVRLTNVFEIQFKLDPTKVMSSIRLKYFCDLDILKKDKIKNKGQKMKNVFDERLGKTFLHEYHVIICTVSLLLFQIQMVNFLISDFFVNFKNNVIIDIHLSVALIDENQEPFLKIKYMSKSRNSFTQFLHDMWCPRGDIFFSFCFWKKIICDKRKYEKLESLSVQLESYFACVRVHSQNI